MTEQDPFREHKRSIILRFLTAAAELELKRSQDITRSEEWRSVSIDNPNLDFVQAASACTFFGLNGIEIERPDFEKNIVLVKWNPTILQSYL